VTLEARIAAAIDRVLPGGVASAYLFGSEAEGRAHRESDVDVGVLLAPGSVPDDRERFALRLDLMGELAAELGGRQADVVLLDDAPPMLAKRIVLDGRRILDELPETDRAFVRRAILAAADLEPWLRHFTRRKLEVLAGR
jgi:predicted nucleotidyltransferase